MYYKKQGICLNCKKEVKAIVFEDKQSFEYHGQEIIVKEPRIFCKECGEEIDTPGRWNETLKRIHIEFNKGKRRKIQFIK